MTTKLKVLQVIDSFRIGGAERVVLDLVTSNAFQDACDVDICILDNSGKQFDVHVPGASVYCLNWSLRRPLDSLSKLRGIISSRRYNIVHSHLFPANLLAGLASYGLPSRLVTTEHSAWNRRREHRVAKPLDKLVYWPYTEIVCVSDGVRDALLAWIPNVKDKTSVILNGLAFRSTPAAARTLYDIAVVANLRRAKGIDLLLASLALVEVKSLAPRVVIVGDGPERDSLQRQAAALDLANVEFMGHRTDVVDILAASRMQVIPSRWEGMPIALLEGLSQGLPIIASAVGGIPEVVQNGENGLLIEPENPQALAQAIARLLRDDSLRSALQENALKTSQRYNIERCAQQYVSVYRGIASGER